MHAITQSNIVIIIKHGLFSIWWLYEDGEVLFFVFLLIQRLAEVFLTLCHVLTNVMSSCPKGIECTYNFNIIFFSFYIHNNKRRLKRHKILHGWETVYRKKSLVKNYLLLSFIETPEVTSHQGKPWYFLFYFTVVQ